MPEQLKRKKRDFYRYDRQEVRRVLETEGLEAASKLWPKEVVYPIARLMGLIAPYRTSSIWKDEWTALLGTKPDETLAAELNISRATVTKARHTLGIKSPFLTYGSRKAYYSGLLQSLSDKELSRPLADLSKDYGLPAVYLCSERKLRKMDIPRGARIRLDHPSLRMAAVAGMIAACPNVTLQEMGTLLGCTRERARQILVNVKVALNSASLLNDSESSSEEVPTPNSAPEE